MNKKKNFAIGDRVRILYNVVDKSLYAGNLRGVVGDDIGTVVHLGGAGVQVRFPGKIIPLSFKITGEASDVARFFFEEVEKVESVGSTNPNEVPETLGESTSMEGYTSTAEVVETQQIGDSLILGCRNRTAVAGVSRVRIYDIIHVYNARGSRRREIPCQVTKLYLNGEKVHMILRENEFVVVVTRWSTVSVGNLITFHLPPND